VTDASYPAPPAPAFLAQYFHEEDVKLLQQLTKKARAQVISSADHEAEDLAGPKYPQIPFNIWVPCLQEK
jgi:hypothetical protein